MSPDETSPGETSPDETGIVELTDVRHRFGGNPALRGLNLAAAEGSITVLVGPNGAGKTTAIRAITGALAVEAGTVRVFALDPAVEGEAVRRRCGVVSAKPALYDRLTGRDNLRYSADLYGLGRGATAEAAIEDAAGRFGIVHALDQQVGGYSTGMKTRLALARSIVHQPDLLLLDEPTSGLDPESSVQVLSMIRSMTEDGRTVIMCTHLLLEAEGLADRIVVLEGGADVVTGTPGDLTSRYWPGVVVRLDAEDRSSLDRLRGNEGVLAYDRPAGGGPVVVQLDHPGRVPDLVARLAAEGVRLTRVEPHTPTLEDLYFAVRGLRREELAA